MSESNWVKVKFLLVGSFILALIPYLSDNFPRYLSLIWI